MSIKELYRRWMAVPINKKIISYLILMTLLDIAWVIASVSVVFFTAQKIVKILVVVAQEAAQDPLALSRTALDPTIVIPLYFYLFILLISLSFLWFIFQGINWWVAFIALGKHLNFLHFMLKFLAPTFIWLALSWLTHTGAVFLVSVNASLNIVDYAWIGVIDFLIILLWTYFYVAVTTEMNNNFVNAFYEGWRKSLTQRYLGWFVFITIKVLIPAYFAFILFSTAKILTVFFVISTVIMLNYSRLLLIEIHGRNRKKRRV